MEADRVSTVSDEIKYVPLVSDDSDHTDEEIVCTFVAEDGNYLKSLNCGKHPGHDNFIPIVDFKLEHLPEKHRDEETLRTVLLWANLTVKIKVKFVSRERPEKYNDFVGDFPNYKFRGSKRKVTSGSGFIHSITREDDVDRESKTLCACLPCQGADDPKSECWYFTVLTSIHIIFDSSEAERSVIQCFYDSDDDDDDDTVTTKVKYLYGVSTYQQTQKDSEKMCYVVCVTHDKELAETLQDLIKRRDDVLSSIHHTPSPELGPAVLISHPHGYSKTITVGHVLHLTVPMGGDYKVDKPTLFEEETECIFPYGSFSQASMVEFMQAFGIDPTPACPPVLDPATDPAPIIRDQTDNSGNETTHEPATTSSTDETTNYDPITQSENDSATNSIGGSTSDPITPPGKDDPATNSIDGSTSDPITPPGKDDPATNSIDGSTSDPITPPGKDDPGTNSTDESSSGRLTKSSNCDPSTNSTDQTSTDSTTQPENDQTTNSTAETPSTSNNETTTDGGESDQTTSTPEDITYDQMSDQTTSDNNSDKNEPLHLYYVEDAVESTTPTPVEPPPDHLVSLTLPPKMTFTLPNGAEFSRRYNDMKALFHFPPNTKFHLANGKDVSLPSDAQFYSNQASIQNGYVSYRVDSCPGSSGGCMLLDGGKTFHNTFPHGGSLSSDVSMCAMRCYPILPSAL